MPRSSRVTLAVAVLLLCPRSGHHAQAQGADIELQAFRPALDSRGFVTVDGSAILEPGQPSFGLVTTWARHPLELDGDGASYRVEHLLTPTLIAALGLPHLELAAALPFGVMAGDRDPDSDGGTPGLPNDDDRYGFGGQGLGDLGLHLKLHLLGGDRGGLALA